MLSLFDPVIRRMLVFGNPFEFQKMLIKTNSDSGTIDKPGPKKSSCNEPYNAC